MEPLFFCPLWGHPESEIESFCARVAEAGFDGVEIYLPLMDNAYRDRVLALLGKHKLGKAGSGLHIGFKDFGAVNMGIRRLIEPGLQEKIFQGRQQELGEVFKVQT
jgi:sugar phosphate isomerase/epimerase